ncbi:xenotropic and polytropic retrovirus receptor 1 homolog [Drosophila pseudoobscura]|uniref:Xenotropic and polytropic retrovirus receptor 1 homolog n=1 Tax=Drosophila pseudoobscura pseudoobscura TaxID=46245 RepID=A0A6I8UIR2_DROPS|nr:xenotropic and polytropic retrovirus receptor 1 homolog [Drosophila pseudoobscura]
MKFGKTFESLLTSEWRQQYMNYADLKAMIREATENAPDPKEASSFEIESYFNDFETLFFSTCLEELNRVNEFFKQKISEARRKLATLKYQFLVSDRHRDPLGHAKSKMHLDDGGQRKPLSQRKLRLASTEFYLSLIMLQNYQTLNQTAFRKICKKYDKYIRSSEGASWFHDNALYAEFARTTELTAMVTSVEDLYTGYLANGDRSKAMAKLRVPPLGEKTSPTRVFFAGLFLGLFIVGAVMSVISWFSLDLKPGFEFMFVSLLRGPIMLVVYGIYLALNVGIWQKVGINHVLIFEVEPRNHVGFLDVLEIVCFFGYLCTIVILGYLYSDEFGIEEYYILPLIYMALMAVMFLNPIRIMNFPLRLWLLKLFGRVLAAPFFYVGFGDFWVGDQLTSMVLCLVDHYYLVRFYIRYYNKMDNLYGFEPDYGVAVIRCLPAWFRLAQCLRRYRDSGSKSKVYLMNAAKYCLAIMVVVFSTIQMETNAKYDYMFQNPWAWLYISTALLTSVYSLGWDLLQDFGLFRIWKRENLFLRENLVFPKWFYYFAILENTLLRFVWILEIVLVHFDVLTVYHCKSLIIFCEITRRFVWNLLRLENEHLNNCGKFRATRDIFLTALNPTEELLLERMMDESDHRLSSRLSRRPTPDPESPRLDKKYF